MNSITGYFDRVRVRKYVSPEPTYSVGTEQVRISAPTITLDSPADLSWSASTVVNHQFTPSDNTGFGNCSIWNNATGTWALNQTNTSAIVNGSINTIQVTYTADGDYLWGVQCYDNGSPSLSNFSTTNRTVKIDATAPSSVSYVLPTESDGAIKSRNWYYVNVTFTESNPEVCILNTGGSNYSMTRVANNCYRNMTEQSDGIYTYKVYINDSAGNIGYSSNRTIILDTIAPDIAIVLPSNTTYNSVNRALNFTAADSTSGVSTIYYQYNGTDTTVTGNTTFTALNNQQSTLTLYANDSAGNLNSASVTFTIDTISPSLISYTPSAGAVGVDTNATVTLAFSENMNQSTFGGVTLKDSDNNNIPISLYSYNNATNTAIFWHSTVLGSNKAYTVNLTGLADPAGNALPDRSWSFTTATAYNITLSKSGANGWNLISLPVVPTNTSPSSVLSGVINDIETAWAYSGITGNWSMYAPNNPSSDLTQMTAGYGYWINYNNSVSKSITGSGNMILEGGQNTPPQRTLTSGWNLIGYYQRENTNAISSKCALFTLTPNINDETAKWWSLVFGYDNQNKQLTQIGYTANMTPGQGYWIFMTSKLSTYLYGPGLSSSECA